MARSGVSSGYDDSHRAKRIALIAGVAIFLSLWIGVVAWLGRMDAAGGSDQASSQVPPPATQQAQEQTPDDESEARDQGTNQGSDAEQAPQEEAGISREEGSVPQGAFDPLEEEGGKPEDSGRTEESGAPSSAEIDMTRARTASERYIVSAYGYTGSDEEEYLSAVEEAASHDIYNSPGGKRLQDYATAAPECGMKSTAIIEEFEMMGLGREGLDAVVTFSVKDGDGQTHTFAQEQRLTSSDEVYEVSGVSVEELISDTTPTESCPGSGADESSGNDSASDSERAVSDERQVSSAAGRFVTAAYGYTGNSTQEYRAGVEKAAITEELLASPGGERINDYSGTAGEDGIKAAAKLGHFETISKAGEEIQGVAYFDVGRSYDRYGDLEGETTPYSQELTLKPYEGSYRVSSASAEEQITGASTGNGATEDSPNSAGNERKLTR